MDKFVVITGASSGIGAGILQRFKSEGYNIIAIDKSPLSSEFTDDVHFYQTDITREHELRNAYEDISEKTDHVDVIVNSAGTIENAAGIENLNIQEFKNILDVNLLGAFLISKLSVPLLKNSTSPSIINIGSIRGIHSRSQYLAYSSSKAGLLSITYNLAKELAKFKIRVNMVSPGSVVGTGFWDMQNDKPLDLPTKLKLINASPLKKLTTVKSIANAVSFLASEAAENITGIDLKIDTGISLG